MRLLKPFLLTVAFTLLCCSTVFCQRNYVEDADKAFNQKQYYTAIDKYKKAMSKVKTNRAERNRISYQIAECYRMMNDAKAMESSYNRLIKAKYYTERPAIYFYLGEAQRTLGKFEDAVKNYNEYLKLVPNDVVAKNAITSCTSAQQIIDNPTRYEVKNEKKLNTRDNEWAPRFGDAKKCDIVVFTSSREGSTGKATDQWTNQNFSDLYYTQQDRKGNWSSADLFDYEMIINTDANEGEASFNEKGDVIYFTRCDVEKNKNVGCRIYTSSKKGNSWDEPKVLELGKDSANYIHPTVSPNELTIVFASNRAGGEGDYDLWMAKRSKKSQPFGAPVNLGKKINTPAKEEFPCFRNDSTLYFSSNGLVGLGGYDLFVTRLQNGEWSEPENLKAPLNSVKDDIGIIFYPDSKKSHPDEERGFLSSNRAGGRGGDDIYSFYLAPILVTLQGVVRDDENLQLLSGANIKLSGSDGTLLNVKTDGKGAYRFDNRQVKVGVTYTLFVEKQGYFPTDGTESFVGITANKDAYKNFRLKPIPKEPIVLPEILYELGRWELLAQYQDSLIGLIKILQDNPKLVIELGSHTDSRPIPMTNDTLSQRRAQSVVDYLIVRGIDPERLVAKGYGARNPRYLSKETTINFVPRNAAAGTKPTPYTFPAGATLTDEYIASLKNHNEKEAAHQLNRRTEFKILRDDYVSKKGTNDSLAGTVSIVREKGIVPVQIMPEGSVMAAVVNGSGMQLLYDEKAKESAISYTTATEFLLGGRINKHDFKENENAIDSVGNIIERSTIILKSVTIGDQTFSNVEVVVIKDAKYPVIFNKAVMNTNREAVLDKEKQVLKFTTK